jgi:hypothetical protein
LKKVEKECALEREYKMAIKKWQLEEGIKIMEECLKNNQAVSFQQMMLEARMRAQTKSDL